MNEKYMIEPPKENEVRRIEVSDIFYIEIMEDNEHKDMVDFWLCRKFFGFKSFITGIQKKEVSDPQTIRYICTIQWIATAQELFELEEKLEEDF